MMSEHGARTMEAVVLDHMISCLRSRDDKLCSDAANEIEELLAALAAAGDRTAVPHDQREPESELLSRAREYLASVPNRSDCGPHHIVSDLIAHIEAVSPGKVEGWREIESAPKDGTRIIVFGPYDDLCIAAYQNNRWVSYGCDGPAISSQCDFGTDYQELEVVTGWQPLPSPPISSRAEDS